MLILILLSKKPLVFNYINEIQHTIFLKAISKRIKLNEHDFEHYMF